MRKPFDSVSGAFSDLAHTGKQLMNDDFLPYFLIQNHSCLENKIINHKLFSRMSFGGNSPPSKCRII